MAPADPLSSSLTSLDDSADRAERSATRSAAPIQAVEAPQAPLPPSPGSQAVNRVLERFDRFETRLDDLEGRLSIGGVTASASSVAPASMARVASAPAGIIPPSTAYATPYRGQQQNSSIPSGVTSSGPPHLLPRHSTPARPSDVDRLVNSFRSLDDEDKDSFRLLCQKMGVRSHKVIDALGAISAEDGAFDATFGPPPSVPALSSDRMQPHSSSTTPPRFIQCKPEWLPKFDGVPENLEHFLGRILDIARSNGTEAWDSAMARTLPLVLTGDAASWHEGLSLPVARSLDSVAAYAKALRQAFPVDEVEQRRRAQERKWIPEDEPAQMYHFDKIRLLRTDDPETALSEVRLVQDLLDGLPPSFRALMHLPRRTATRDDVRLELVEVESLWRKLSPDRALRTAKSAAAESSDRTASSSSGGRGSRSAPAGLSTPARAPAAVPPAAVRPGGPLGMSATYDKSRIVEAKNGRPRMYRWPDSTKVLELSHPCKRCGQDHFDFEHNDLVPPVRVMDPVDSSDYKIIDESDLSSEDF
ncbi:hypothetical protein CF336_g9108 [Tilletia laevis]|nr:hypothetical protein CF336_g9108 [Tilletia laevis]